MDEYDQMRKAKEIGKLMKEYRLLHDLSLRSESVRRGISSSLLSRMEQGKVIPILPVGMRVRLNGIHPGVGVVVEEQSSGVMIKFDDFDYPNAYFWYEVDPDFDR